MGNSSSNLKSKTDSSTEKKFNNSYDIIDYIATYYILTMDFKSLSKLSQKEYCDNLVVLTADIIKQNFNDMQIQYLAQRVKNGVQINEMAQENVIFFNKDKLDELDIKNDTQKSIKKKRVCIGIAKFYVKIAHIFAAIVMTINPIYVYKDSYGNTIKSSLFEKDTIPKNINRKIYKLNICDNRINSLNNGENYNDISGDNAKIHPKICGFNNTKDGINKTLEDEPGIKELMELYLDDNYDYSTGLFTGMSSSTKSQFMKDLKTFYTAFTGNEVMPPEITKFSDIKLRDYNSTNNCNGDNPLFKNDYVVNKNDELFINYANNIKEMISSASETQSKLLSVINTLFIYVPDTYSGKKKIKVNPALTEASLQIAVENTRKIIIQLYVNCENDFVKGVKLYEAIIEKKILETTQNQIFNLEKESKNIIANNTNNYNPKSNFVKLPIQNVNVNVN